MSSSKSRMRAVLAHCQAHGLPEPVLLRAAAGTSLYRAGDLVVRVAAPQRSAMTGAQQVAAAGLLANHGVRTVTSRGPMTLTEDGEELTVWDHIAHDTGLPYATHGLGAQVRALHGIPVPLADAALGGLPRWGDALVRARARVETFETVGYAETGVPAGALRGLFDELEQQVIDGCGGAPDVLLHGDLNPGNVLRVPDADPYLIDLEALTVGPWFWDLVNTAFLISDGDFGPDAMATVLTGYGRSLDDEPAWGAVCWLRAVNVVSWMFLEARAGGAVTPQKARRRLAWLADGFPGLPAPARP